MLRYGLLLLPLMFMTGCAVSSPDTHETDVKALKDLETAWVKDANTKDPEKFASYYTEDGSILLPNAPIITGKAAIRDALKPLFSDPNFALQFSSTKQDVSKSGDLGYTVGTYTLTVTNEKDKKPLNDKGKYSTIYKKQADGSWKAVVDILNSDLPAPGEAPAK